MIVEYNDNEFIKLNRKIINWEWYLNVNVKTLFVHCLLKANWKDGKFEGKEVKRGSFVTSLDKLSKETGLSVRQVRTALNHLFLTGELTSVSCSKYRVITVTNYNQYQLCDKQVDSQVTSKRQASDKQATTIEEYIRSKEEQELKNKDYMSNNSNELLDCPSEEQPDEEKHGAYDDLLKLWNSLESFGIQPIRAITKQRITLLKPRLKEYGRESFAECVEQIRQSDFLQGKHGGKPWAITFDWMIRPTNYPKVLEGNYNNKKGNAVGNNQSQYLQDIIGMMKGESV